MSIPNNIVSLRQAASINQVSTFTRPSARPTHRQAAIHVRSRIKGSGEKGVVLFYFAFLLIVLLLFAGLAIDLGRAYVVKAQLSKAVDGAALAGARALNTGDPKTEASRIFRANFPLCALGTSGATDPTTDTNFFKSHYESSTGVNIVTVSAIATLPTTFMRVGNFQQITVGSVGEATRRMVDLSLVLDVSSSLGAGWPAVRDAAREFVNSFDAFGDRIALITYSDGARVLDRMPSSRGFDKTKVKNDVPNNLPGGSTAMVEGFYRGWDELRTVPFGSQSGLRVIVLFTDGCSNSVPGVYNTKDRGNVSGVGLRTYDFPKRYPDPDNQTHENPTLVGLFDTETGSQTAPYSLTPLKWDSTNRIPQIDYLPLTSFHAHHRSSGIPTSFPLSSSSLTVNGVRQDQARLWRGVVGGRYPADIWNTNNAARNVLEIIADAARNDTSGDYPIRVYTIGMGNLLKYLLGTMPELPEDILKRISNDKTSTDFNSAQLEGKYYYAQTAADVGPAFQALRNQLIRLSK